MIFSPHSYRAIGFRLLFLASAALACLSLCGFARAVGPPAPISVPSTPAPAPKLVFLSGGAHLVLKPEPDAETVAIAVVVRTDRPGSEQENAVGELTARALFFGSVNRSFDAVAASVGQVGGSLETERTPDYVMVSCVTVPGQLREALYLICEGLKNADFAPDALARARKLLRQERAFRAQDAFLVAYETARDLVRGTTDADNDALARVTPEQCRDYFVRHYVPAHTTLCLAGKFDAAPIQRSVENYLFDYDRSAPVRPHASPPAFVAPDSDTPFHLTALGRVSYALVALPAPALDSPDYAPFLVLRALLGGGHAARLFRRVRDTLGVGYNIGALWQPDRSDPLVAYLQWGSEENRREIEEHEKKIKEKGKGAGWRF